MKPFEKDFLDADVSTFGELVSGLAGAECSAWRKAYGSTGSLHFGKLRPKLHSSPRVVHRDEGEWFVQLWDCDRTLRLPTGQEFRSRENDAAILENLGKLVGLRVNSVHIDPKTLDVTLRFLPTGSLVLSPHPDSAPDSEQWNIVLPSRQEIVLWPARRWALRAEGQ